MTDRELAIKVRRLLLAVVAMIEEYYKLGKHAEVTIQEVGERDNIIFDIVVK
jgi:hypothetical protein